MNPWIPRSIGYLVKLFFFFQATLSPKNIKQHWGLRPDLSCLKKISVIKITSARRLLTLRYIGTLTWNKIKKQNLKQQNVTSPRKKTGAQSVNTLFVIKKKIENNVGTKNGPKIPNLSILFWNQTPQRRKIQPRFFKLVLHTWYVSSSHVLIYQIWVRLIFWLPEKI